MPDDVTYVHVSGGLLGPSLIAELRNDAERRGPADATTFARNGDQPSAGEVREAAEFALENLANRWDNLAETIDDFDLGRLRERWLVPLMRELNFDPRFQRGDIDLGGERFKISHLGWEGGDAPLVLLVKDDLDERPGARVRSPHDELQAALNHSEQHNWGILANARRLRILRDFHHRRTRGYVEFELDAIFSARSYADFLALWRLAEATRFRLNGRTELVLEEAYRDSLREGVAVGKKLQPQVLKALEAIANGVLTADLRARISEAKEARAFYRELLTFLYRILFLLFAEQRRLLPASDLYADSYGITRLRALAEEGRVERRRHDLWEGLKVTFRALAGDGSDELGAFAFNGPLFDETRTPILSAAHCSNADLLRAIRELTTVDFEGVRQFVNFGELGVEELGAVYESLLDYIPVVVGTAVQLQPMAEERKDLGSYYTPAALVDLVLQKSLDKLIVERLEAAGTEVSDRETALLDIKVCDPACGSAAFLVGAVDRLALALAEVRRGGAPDEHDLRLARRDVLQHCIYGVDKDELAVELAKVALWIHCAADSLPLTFLDHRIQHGDSLVGWGFQKLPEDIPDEAYEKPAWRALNSPQLVFGEEHPPPPDPHLTLPPLEEQPENSPTDVDAKAAAYRAYLALPEVRRWTEIADLWTAAFLWDGEAGLPPATRDYWRALSGERPAQTDDAQRLAGVFPFFHWALRFPEIRDRGGFDCIIGNPPWEQFKPSEQEWFAGRAPKIAALTGAERRGAIKALKEERPELHKGWESYVHLTQRLSEYSRHSGRFARSGGEANTYLLFSELAADHLGGSGRAGVLVKSGLALDRGSQAVFQRLLDRGRIVELHDIVNGGPTGTNLIFPAIDAKERFSILALAWAGASRGFDATVMNWNLEEVVSRPPHHFTREILSTLNPRTRSLTSFRDSEALELALDIHRRLSVLDFEDEGENAWGLSYYGLFHSSGASDRFLKRERLEPEGWILRADKVFERGGEIAVPLYEGQLANRYDHRARTYEGYAGDRKYSPAPGIPSTTDLQKADPRFEVEPRYWIPRELADARLKQTVGERAMIGFRNATRPWREQRSVRGALLPRVPATHGLPVLALDLERACEFLGVFNSTTFDFLVRGHIPGQNVALTWMLSQIAAPSPGLDARISFNAERLSFTSCSIADLFEREPYKWDAVERYRLDVETDALVALAYGLDRVQYEIVLDSFEVMARMQTAEHGTHKFKEDCLAVFDQLRGEG